MKFIALALLMLAGSAQGATNLAVVTSDATCAGQPVATAVCVAAPQYGVPKSTDLVRISDTNQSWSPTFRWVLESTVAVGQRREVCLDEVPAGPVVGSDCDKWGWVAKGGSSYVATPGVVAWIPYRSSTYLRDAAGKQIARATLDECQQYLAGLKLAQSYTCRASVAVAVKLVAVPTDAINITTSVIPPVAPPVTPPVLPPTGAANEIKKGGWNPGHYLRSNHYGSPNLSAERAAAYARIKNEPNIKGALITVPWGVIQRQAGVFDFSEIDKDLAIMKSMGKKLMIELYWMDFWHGPESPGNEFVPDYIVAAGGAHLYEDSRAKQHIAKVDEPWVMDQLIAAYTALGKRYNADPDVEQIIITETAGRSAAQMKRLIPAIAAAWPNTQRVFFMNWVSDSAQLAKELGEICGQYGVGLGGPDILPSNLTQEDHASLVSRGAGLYRVGTWSGDFGSVDYRGKIPMSFSYQAGYNFPPSKLIDYALNNLKATHINWMTTDWLGADMSWDGGVMPTLRNVNFRINTACPSTYRCAP